MGQFAPSLPPGSSKLYWNSAPLDFSVGIIYNFINLQCVGVMPTSRMGFWRLDDTSRGRRTRLCCCFKGWSDIMAPVTGGVEPQSCSRCVRNTRESQSRYLSAVTKSDVLKITGGETERVCFHTQMKLFRSLQGHGGTAAARNIIPRREKANFIL